jgi:choline dehydrogenase
MRGKVVQEVAGLDDFVRQTAATIYHSAGTAKTGDDESGVDAALKLFGIDGLRVLLRVDDDAKDPVAA